MQESQHSSEAGPNGEDIGEDIVTAAVKGLGQEEKCDPGALGFCTGTWSTQPTFGDTTQAGVPGSELSLVLKMSVPLPIPGPNPKQQCCCCCTDQELTAGPDLHFTHP